MYNILGLATIERKHLQLSKHKCLFLCYLWLSGTSLCKPGTSIRSSVLPLLNRPLQPASLHSGHICFCNAFGDLDSHRDLVSPNQIIVDSGATQKLRFEHAAAQYIVFCSKLAFKSSPASIVYSPIHLNEEFVSWCLSSTHIGTYGKAFRSWLTKQLDKKQQAARRHHKITW